MCESDVGVVRVSAERRIGIGSKPTSWAGLLVTGRPLWPLEPRIGPKREHVPDLQQSAAEQWVMDRQQGPIVAR